MTTAPGYTNMAVIINLRAQLRALQFDPSTSTLLTSVCRTTLAGLSGAEIPSDVLNALENVKHRMNTIPSGSGFHEARGCYERVIDMLQDALKAMMAGEAEAAKPEPEPKPDLSQYPGSTLVHLLDQLAKTDLYDATDSDGCLECTPEHFQHILDNLNAVAQELLRRQQEKTQTDDCRCALCVEERRRA